MYISFLANGTKYCEVQNTKEYGRQTDVKMCKAEKASHLLCHGILVFFAYIAAMLVYCNSKKNVHMYLY